MAKSNPFTKLKEGSKAEEALDKKQGVAPAGKGNPFGKSKAPPFGKGKKK